MEQQVTDPLDGLDVSVRHDSRIESVCTDPDPVTYEIRVDGVAIGEWGLSAAHDVEVALEERIVDAQIAHYATAGATVEVVPVGEHGAEVLINGRALGASVTAFLREYADEFADRAREAIKHAELAANVTAPSVWSEEALDALRECISAREAAVRKLWSAYAAATDGKDPMALLVDVAWEDDRAANFLADARRSLVGGVS